MRPVCRDITSSKGLRGFVPEKLSYDTSISKSMMIHGQRMVCDTVQGPITFPLENWSSLNIQPFHFGNIYFVIVLITVTNEH